MLARLSGAALAALILMLLPSLASAATVSVPVGAAVGGVAAFALPLAGSFAAFLIVVASKLAPPLAATLRTQQVEQLIAWAISYGINATAGALKGKVLSVDVANEVAATALRYVIDHGPGWLIGWMGGKDQIREKILARLPLGEDAAIANGVVVPGGLYAVAPAAAAAATAAAG